MSPVRPVKPCTPAPKIADGYRLLKRRSARHTQERHDPKHQPGRRRPVTTGHGHQGPDRNPVTPLFNKLNLGTHRCIAVLNAPAPFEAELAALQGVEVLRSAQAPLDYALAFVITQAELDAASHALVQAAAGDALLWMAYPKGSSRRYRCEFQRDSGWAVLGSAGYEPVRMVAIDEDWSALRFRQATHIATLKRDPARAISAAGRRRAGG